MNQKKIRKRLHHLDEQTAKRIADEYPATDQATKEKIYHQICERRHSMQDQKAGKQEMIAKTYHTPGARAIPWARTLGMAAACAIFMGGTIGGIWKLTRLQTPSEEAEELKFVAESNTTNPTESTTSSETSITTQALAVIAITDTTMTTTFTTTQTAPVTAITAITTTSTTSTTATTTIPPIHKETVISATEPVMTDADTAPVAVTEPPITEPDATVPPVETIQTETEPVTTRPAYLTAYLEICEEYEKDFDNLSYCLYDVDKDGTPELIIHGFSYWISLYTYADNQVYELMDKWSYGINNNMGYCFHPEKNSIYYNVGEYAGRIYHNIYLTITPEHTLIEENVLTSVNDADTLFEEYSYLKNDASHSYINGNGYYLNYEKITEEEFNTFYTKNYPTNYNADLEYKSYSEFLENLPE